MKVSNLRGHYFPEMNDLYSRQINVIKNFEPVSSKISTDRPLVKQ